MRNIWEIPGFYELSYPERLRKLKLPTLSYRRLRGDLIEVYKIVHDIYDPDAIKFVKFMKDCAPDMPQTRGNVRNPYRLFHHTPKLDHFIGCIITHTH